MRVACAALGALAVLGRLLDLPNTAPKTTATGFGQALSLPPDTSASGLGLLQRFDRKLQLVS